MDADEEPAVTINSNDDNVERADVALHWIWVAEFHALDSVAVPRTRLPRERSWLAPDTSTLIIAGG